MAFQQWVWLDRPKIDRVRASVRATIRVHRVVVHQQVRCLGHPKPVILVVDDRKVG
jgi:hypothetical protein